MPADPACELFLQFSRNKLLEQYWPRLRKAVETLSDEQLWWRPNDASNSIGNLILHLNGNVWQWLVASFNRLDDKRDRPAEFNATGDLSAADLLGRLGQTLDEASEGAGAAYAGGIACDVADPGIYRERARCGLPGCGAFWAALRADRLHHQNAGRPRSWFLQRTEQDGSRQRWIGLTVSRGRMLPIANAGSGCRAESSR